MGRQIAGASAPSCQPGLCPCPCCINYPTSSSSTSPETERDPRRISNAEFEAFSNDTTTLLNRLRSHVLPNPAQNVATASSPAADIRISTSISASRAAQQQQMQPGSLLDDNMLPPRLGTPIPSRTHPFSAVDPVIASETLPSLPSSFHNTSVSSAIRARLEELDEQIARTMLRSERNRNRSRDDTDASMDRVNTAIENSRSALSQARDAIRNALQHSERLERIASVLRRQVYSPDAATVSPVPGSTASAATTSPPSAMEALVRSQWSSASIVRATGRQSDTPRGPSGVIDEENARTQTNLDRSLADLRAASMEIDRVISLTSSERSSGPQSSNERWPLSPIGSLPPTPPPPQELLRSRSQTPERMPTQSHSNEGDTSIGRSPPRRPPHSRWLSGDSAGISLSTQSITTMSSRSDAPLAVDYVRPRSIPPASSGGTSALSQASAELRNSTVALARRVLANTRTTRETFNTTSATPARESPSASSVTNSPLSRYPQVIRDISFDPSTAGALYFPSDPESDDDTGRVRVRADRRLAANPRAPGQASSSTNQTERAPQPPSRSGTDRAGSEIPSAAIGDARQADPSQAILNLVIRSENISALRYVTQASDSEDSGRRRAANAPRVSRALPTRGGRETLPPLPVLPVANATPATAAEPAVLTANESDESETSDDMAEEDDEDEYWQPSRTRRPLLPLTSRPNQLDIDGLVASNASRRNLGGWRQVDANGDVIEQNDGLPPNDGRDSISGGNGRGWYWTPPAVAGIMNEDGEEKVPLYADGDGGDADGQPRSSNNRLGQSAEGEMRYKGNPEMVGR